MARWTTPLLAAMAAVIVVACDGPGPTDPDIAAGGTARQIQFCNETNADDCTNQREPEDSTVWGPDIPSAYGTTFAGAFVRTPNFANYQWIEAYAGNEHKTNIQQSTVSASFTFYDGCLSTSRVLASFQASKIIYGTPAKAFVTWETPSWPHGSRRYIQVVARHEFVPMPGTAMYPTVFDTNHRECLGIR